MRPSLSGNCSGSKDFRFAEIHDSVGASVMLDEKFLDASEMEPPVPFEQALALLAELQPGQYLRMAHRMIPYPLFDYCNERKLEYRVLHGKAARYEVLIWYPQDTALISHLFEEKS